MRTRTFLQIRCICVLTPHSDKSLRQEKLYLYVRPVLISSLAGRFTITMDIEYGEDRQATKWPTDGYRTVSPCQGRSNAWCTALSTIRASTIYKSAITFSAIPRFKMFMFVDRKRPRSIAPLIVHPYRMLLGLNRMETATVLCIMSDLMCAASRCTDRFLDLLGKKHA